MIFQEIIDFFTLSNSDNIQYAVLPALLALAPALPTIMQGIGGIKNLRQSKLDAERLGEKPKIEVPTAISELSDQPISEEYMEDKETQNLLSQQSILDALSEDPRSLLLGTEGIVSQQDAIARKDLADYTQAKTDALKLEGEAQAKVIEGERKDWDDTAAAIAARDKAAKEQLLKFGKTAGTTLAGFSAFKGSAGIDPVTGKGPNFKDYMQSPAFLQGLGFMEHGGNIPENNDNLVGLMPVPNVASPTINISIGGGEEKKEDDCGCHDMEETKEPVGEPEVTPGEFNHETNPIDLVQNGQKIGEATGGEVIINPEDTKTIEEFVTSGDEDGLMNFTRNLFARFNKQEQEQKEVQKAEKGMNVGETTPNLSSKMGSFVPKTFASLMSKIKS